MPYVYCVEGLTCCTACRIDAQLHYRRRCRDEINNNAFSPRHKGLSICESSMISLICKPVNLYASHRCSRIAARGCRDLPAEEPFVDLLTHSRPRGGTVAMPHEQRIVLRMLMSDVSNDCQSNRSGVKFFGCGAPADTARIFSARVGGDCSPLVRRTPRKHFEQRLGKRSNIFTILAFPTFRCTLAFARAAILIL